MSKNYHDHYKSAVKLRDSILAGKTNTTIVKAWASVARECAISENKFREENTGVHGRSQQSFLSNLDKINWYARAQLSTLTRHID